jgi:amino acid transporter
MKNHSHRLASAVALCLPLLAFALLWRIADRKHGEPYRKIVTQWALDGVAILALIVAAYGPYWDGPKMFDSILAQPTRGVSSPFWLLPHQLAQFEIGTALQLDRRFHGL